MLRSCTLQKALCLWKPSQRKCPTREIFKIVNSSYHHIAIVGTGPSGFYTAKYCLDLHESVRVDLFEKLPTPYGLVRSGVAPDHPEVKTVQETFTQVAESPRVRLFANVEIGDENSSSNRNDVIPIQELMRSYSAVVLAHGASSDLTLNIPGEELPGVLSSRSFVNWYNGHPDFANLHETAFDLKKVEHVVVVGQGNVALDCARILSKHPDDLRETDISTVAHNELCQSSVKSVTILGRRGHIQSAFTIKELRELTRMRGVKVHIDETELQKGKTDASIAELANNRPKKRIVDLIETIAKGVEIPPSSEDLAAETATATNVDTSIDRTIDFRYLVTPVEIKATTPSGDATHSPAARVASVVLKHNRLQGIANQQKAVPNDQEPLEIIPCDLLIKSVGYKCEALGPSIPFNKQTNTIPHLKGRVLSSAHTATTAPTDTPPVPSPVRGMYVTGWLKRGATGIIASNIPDAKETAASIGEDMRNSLLTPLDDAILSTVTNTSTGTNETQTSNDIQQTTTNMNSKDVDPVLPWMTSAAGQALLQRNQIVSWRDYRLIEMEETRRGELHTPPKLKEKILSKLELVTIAKGHGEQNN